jgi:DNA-binding Xre family transcriptional regulator
VTGNLDYRWKLRDVMAAQGMYSTAALRPLLIERGIVLSVSQVYRLVTEKPERLSLKVLMALLDIFGCTMGDLIEPVTATAGTPRKAAAGGQDPGPGVGGFRPRRARIVPED